MRSTYMVLAGLLYTSLVPGATLAQAQAFDPNPVQQNTPPGMEAGPVSGTFPLSGFADVNLFSGNLSVHLPILSIGGRGEVGYTMMLNVNSKQWYVHKVCTQPPTPQNPVDDCGVSRRHIPKRRDWDGGGALSFEPGALKFQQEVKDPYRNSNGYCLSNPSTETLTRLRFTGPDGAEIQFRDDKTKGKVKGATCDGGVVPNGYNRGRTWVSTDGQSATFSSDNDVSDCPTMGCGTAEATGRLKFRNGTIYRIVNGQVSWMRDRNGNQVSFARVPGVSLTITDPLNRTITVTRAQESQDVWTNTISYKGHGNVPRQIVVKYSLLDGLLSGENADTLPLTGLFPDLAADIDVDPSTPDPIYNPLTIESVQLPDGRFYKFEYNPYNEPSRIKLPTGATYEYEYSSKDNVRKNSQWMSYPIDSRVTKQTVYEANSLGGAELSKTAFIKEYYPANGTPFITGRTEVWVDKRDVHQVTKAREKHVFYGVPTYSPEGYFLEPYWKDGRIDRVEYLQPAVPASEGAPAIAEKLLRKVRTVWATRVPQDDAPPGTISYYAYDLPPGDPRVQETNTWEGTTLNARRTFVYDANNNVTAESDFGYDGALLRRRTRTYEDSAGFVTAHIKDRVKTETLCDAAVVVCSDTNHEYDNYTAGTNNADLIRYDSVSQYVPSGLSRGNRTRTQRWTGDQWIARYTNYDEVGNVVATKDGRGFKTIYEYDPTANNYAYRSKVKNPLGHEQMTTWDRFSGRPTTITDANEVLTRFTYTDDLDRITQTVRAEGTSAEQTLSISYDDSWADGTPVGHTIESGVDTSADGRHKATTLYDGLGRSIESRRYETANDYMATQTMYDEQGRVAAVSNPFRPSELPADQGPPKTRSTYDAAGRIKSRTQPRGDTTTWSYAPNLATYALITTIVDPAQRVRKTWTDGYGRIERVREDPTGDLTADTYYTYDIFDNLRTVKQSTNQVRTFTYDRLSRLLTADQPENGRVTSTYDNNGNPRTRTDERNKVLTQTFDDLNRIKTKTYSDATPAVTMTYDAPDALGRLVSVVSSVSASYFDEYDPLGRVLRSRQVTNGLAHPFAYTYDRAGQLRSETLRAGTASARTIFTTYDRAGRIKAVCEGSATCEGTTPLTYAAETSYAAHGALSGRRLGNGLWESNQFNSHLQPTLMGLGSAQGATDLWELSNVFVDPSGRNDGNVHSQTVKAGGPAFTTTYAYDALNRVTDVVEQGTVPGVTPWSHSYDYDRWGNRWVSAATAGSLPNEALTPRSAAAYSITTNQLVTLQADRPYGYDRSGNLKTSPGARYQYDAENRMTSVSATDGSWTTTFGYDSKGRRVTKSNGGFTTTYVYDAFERQVSEYLGGTLRKDNVYFSGRLLAEVDLASSTTRYFTVDHLGSTRVVTTPTGTVATRYDYLPFGEQITLNGRCAAAAEYCNEQGVRWRFTGKERDETGLDYFKARYHSSAAGRFTSVDPMIDWKGTISDPQRWNRYPYVRNTPLTLIDPDGKNVTYADPMQRLQILHWINGRARGRFEWDKKGNLQVRQNKDGGGQKGSQYYADRLIAAIENPKVIKLEIGQRNPVNGEPLDSKNGGGGGITLKNEAGDRWVMISGNAHDDVAKDEAGNAIKQEPEDILLHELVGHAIPGTVGSDTGNAIDNENKARGELGLPLVAPNPDHLETRD